MPDTGADKGRVVAPANRKRNGGTIRRIGRRGRRSQNWRPAVATPPPIDCHHTRRWIMS